MVSFQVPLSPTAISNSIPDLLDTSTKKRKWNENIPDDDRGSLRKTLKPDCLTKSFFEIELHLETPLPSEWQRCLDIQSGQIHFYNTRTHKRTSKDPRRRDSDRPSPGHMSLELELNLPCESQRQNRANDGAGKHGSGGSVRGTSIGAFLEDSCNKDLNKGLGGLMVKRSPWLEGDDVEQQEMMATVCTRCHMLVMLCKKSPSCPNCKFIHPSDQGPPKPFKQSLSLFC